MRALKEEANAASPDFDADLDLTSALHEAAKLIRLVELPQPV
jgi:hypothetical protein